MIRAFGQSYNMKGCTVFASDNLQSNDNLTPRPAINRLVPYSPGKPIEEVKREFGLTDVIKMASNENPLGPSPRAVSAIQEAALRMNLYPDGAAHDLKVALGHRWDLPTGCIVVGNGSDELIHFVGIAYLRPGDNIVQADPTFSRYESAATLNEAECIKVPVKDMKHDLDAMADAVNERTRIVFVANPNNPTGTMNTKKEVERLIGRLPGHALLVLDEAYMEYVDDPDYPASEEYVRAGANVLVLRTFSKAYGLAGLRIGYGLAREGIVNAIEQVREPFNVNSLAQAAAIAALNDTEHIERTRAANSEGKRTLMEAFREMGLNFAPTQGNFMFVDLKRDSRAVFNALIQRGIIVRTGDIFGFPTWLRVTIGSANENSRFISALREVLAS